MSKLKKMLAVSILVSMLLVNFSIVTNVQISEAKATKSAMKFLKGTWVTAGNSGAVKFIFTRRHFFHHQYVFVNFACYCRQETKCCRD